MEISNLSKSFGDVTPLRDVNCQIREGDVISIIGPSGTGKSFRINRLPRVCFRYSHSPETQTKKKRKGKTCPEQLSG